jgi:hypothetical protein
VRREGPVLTDPYFPPGEARWSGRLACGEHDAFWRSMEEEQQRRHSVYRPSPSPAYSHSPPVAYPHPAAYPTHAYPHVPPYPPAPMYSSPPLYPPPPGYPHGYPAYPYPTYSTSPGYAPPYPYYPPPHYQYPEHGRDASEAGPSSRLSVGEPSHRSASARYSLRGDDGSRRWDGPRRRDDDRIGGQ